MPWTPGRFIKVTIGDVIKKNILVGKHGKKNYSFLRSTVGFGSCGITDTRTNFDIGICDFYVLYLPRIQIIILIHLFK